MVDVPKCEERTPGQPIVPPLDEERYDPDGLAHAPEPPIVPQHDNYYD